MISRLSVVAVGLVLATFGTVGHPAAAEEPLKTPVDELVLA